MARRTGYSSVLALIGITLATGAQLSGQTIEPASGKILCSALTPDDFTKTGISVSRLREANLDDAKSAYCIYDATGGKIEVDIYDPAGETPGEAQNAVRAAQSAIGGSFKPISVPGADEASSNVSSSNGGETSIVVRRNTTVFNISIPNGGQAEAQLIKLSKIVMSRLKP